MAIAQDTPKNSPRSIKFLKSYLPLFVIALFLPFLLFFTMNSRSFNISSRADSSHDIRVWLDPTSYEMRAGESYKLTIMASTQNNDLVHGIKIIIPKVEGLAITPTEITYPAAFSGRTKLGEVTITAIRNGNYSISLPPQAITTGVENANVTTSPANVQVLSR